MSLVRAHALSVSFGPGLRAVDAIDLEIPDGQVVGLVGESGSGKSVTALALARLTTSARAAIRADALSFDGRSLMAMGARELRRLRGREMGFIFQNPAHSLNPLLTVVKEVRSLSNSTAPPWVARILLFALLTLMASYSVEGTHATSGMEFMTTGWANHNDAWVLRNSSARTYMRSWLARLLLD